MKSRNEMSIFNNNTVAKSNILKIFIAKKREFPFLIIQTIVKLYEKVNN